MARLIATKTRHDLYGDRPIIELTKTGNQLCYEQCGGRWFRASWQVVKKDIEVFQELYDQENFVNEADLHESIGIKTITKDYEYGWSRLIHGDINLISLEYEQSGFKGMDEPVLVLVPVIPPVKDYAD